MFNISQFLEKFKNLGATTFFTRDAVKASLKEVLGIEVLDANIVVKNQIARIEAAPLIRQMIQIKKAILIEAIKKKGVIVKDIY